jgi:hypothetical protein
MSYDNEEQKDPLEYLLDKGLWFSVIPSSQKKWNATAFKQDLDGRWSGFKSKTHPTVEDAMDWLGKVLKKKAREQEDV